MKTWKLFVIVILTTGIAACKKTSVSSLNLSTADAANMIAGSVAYSSYGVTSISSDVFANAQTTVSNSLGCGYTKIDTIIRQSLPSANVSYLYTLIYNHKLNCVTGVTLPYTVTETITGTLNYNGNFNNPALTLSNSGTTTYTISGLAATASSYTFNAEYKSSGAFKMKADTTNMGTASADVVVTNLTINKATQAITGGSATAIVTGTTVRKGNFTYNGTLTFTGNGMANLTIDGTNYVINLATGGITAK